MTSGITFGLDIGTSRTKVIALDGDGRFLFSEVRATPWTRTTSLPVLDPSDLFSAVSSLVGRAAARASPRPILGMGITSIAETGFLCGEDLIPLAPGRIWYDSHGSAAAVKYAGDFSEEHFPSVTGLPL